MRFSRLAFAFALGVTPALGGEFQVGLGLFALAPHGADVQISYRAAGSPWSFGFRHVQWMDTFHDPFTGHALSETTEARTGPLVTYRFHPQAPGSWYLGGAVYQWSKRERSLVFGDSNRDSTTAPLIGGGYTRSLGTWFYWNAGLFLGPGKTVRTKTSTGSEEDSGVFDIQLQMGVRF